MNDRCYYACSAITDARELFFLWYSDQQDGIVLHGSSIKTFETRDALESYCAMHGFALSRESTAVYDLDEIAAWCAAPNSLLKRPSWPFSTSATRQQAAAGPPKQGILRIPCSSETSCFARSLVFQRAANSRRFDIAALLNAWNMMDDFFKSVGMWGAIPDDALDLHEKLSLANFAVDIPEFFKGKTYDPEWTDSDRIRIAGILKRATAKFKDALPKG